MYKIIKITPFGFIFELENNSCHFNDIEYQIFLNGIFYELTNKNIVSILDLESDREYIVSLRGLKENINFTVKTKKLNFLINVKEYNAVGDGVSNDTSAVNVAIYSAPKGSTVYIPKGIYMVNEILLKSDVDIYLEKDAILKQNINRTELAVLKGYQRSYNHSLSEINASWEGNPLDCYCSLIYGKNVENVNIYGQGQLDGNGDIGSWWINHKSKGVAYRPRNIFLVGCNNISISGISSKNSAAWNIHPFFCKNVSFYDLHIESAHTSPNTDGLNPENCENVKIAGCHFSVGDDCIALKSGKYFMSVRHYKPTTNVEIRNCFMENGHGGVVIGSEMSCGVTNVLVTNCYFRDTDRGIRIKTRRGRGNTAIVENIKCCNIKMNKVIHCFVVNMFYNCDPDGKSDYVKNKTIKVKDDKTPAIRNLTISNIYGKEVAGSCIFIYGLPESKVENITIKNSSFSFAKERIHEAPAMMEDFDVVENLGIFICNGKDISLENNKLLGEHKNVIDEE